MILLLFFCGVNPLHSQFLRVLFSIWAPSCCNCGLNESLYNFIDRFHVFTACMSKQSLYQRLAWLVFCCFAIAWYSLHSWGSPAVCHVRQDPSMLQPKRLLADCTVRKALLSDIFTWHSCHWPMRRSLKDSYTELMAVWGLWLALNSLDLTLYLLGVLLKECDWELIPRTCCQQVNYGVLPDPIQLLFFRFLLSAQI